MKIIIESEILNHDFRKVFSEFNESLFKSLNPSFTPLTIKKFDGCDKGDIVHVIIGRKPFSVTWISEIIDFSQSQEEINFTDVGTTLPFPLKKWKHIHRIIRQGEHKTIIRDEIEYRTFCIAIDYLIYPLMQIQFGVRRKKYSQYFNTIE